MPEVIFPGPEGRLEGRYHPHKTKDAPIAIILHPHPQFGGTMNNRVVYTTIRGHVWVQNAKMAGYKFVT